MRRRILWATSVPLVRQISQPIPPSNPRCNRARHRCTPQISERNKRALICYVSGINSGINRDDTVFLVDLLHNVKRGADLDMMLHSGGGDIDAAEKLISLVRTCVANGRLRIIVPDFAKSAGTLMALGADQVVMSESSELGPIDPQVDINDGRGNVIRHSVQSYLDAYEAHAAALRANPNDVAATIMLNKIEPATVKLFEAVRDRARSFAVRVPEILT